MPTTKRMVGLTVCQPYAHLIALPDHHPRAKRIENRRKPVRHRGQLLIHAGRSLDWLDPEDIADFPNMAFGAAVALVDLVDCVPLERLPDCLQDNEHAHGPFCLLLENARPLPRPIPCRGYQGLWYAEPAIEQAVLAQLAEART